MRHFCLYLPIRLIFTCPSGLYFWVYLPTRLIFLRLTAHQVNFLPAHQVNLSKFTWPVPIRLIFLSLPAHQVVSICKDDTGETLLNSVHTVPPEVITVGVIDFHLRRRESSLYKSLFWAIDLAMWSPLRVPFPNQLKHFLLLFHFLHLR